jgi:hypothetical protein
MMELNQQKILGPREVMMPAGPPRIALTPAADGTFSFQNADPERRWNWVTLSPLELAGNFGWKANGTTTPENVPQMRSDAESLYTMSQDNPNIDGQKITPKILELQGLQNPEAYIAPPKPEVPPETLDILASMGVDQTMIAEALQEALTGQSPAGGGSSGGNGAAPPDGSSGQAPQGQGSSNGASAPASPTPSSSGGGYGGGQ